MKWRVLFCTLAVTVNLGFAAEGDRATKEAGDGKASHARQTPEEKKREEAERAKKNELVAQRNKCLEDRLKTKENTNENRIVPNGATGTVKPASNLDGAALYAANCLICHSTGEGKQGPIKDMTLAHKRTGVEAKSMPPKAAPTQPTDDERKAIQAHLLSLGGK